MDAAAPSQADWLEHLTEGDLRFLAGATGLGPPGGGAAEVLRRRPDAVEEALGHPAAFEAVFSGPEPGDPFLHASPFLVFALAVNRGAREVQRSMVVPEWVGPGRRLPLLGAQDLATFLGVPAYRLFLTELLASYTHVASGAVWVRTRRGLRRRRYSELDPLRLAGLLEVLPEAEHAGVYRRLGDLALFLAGVFPDHTAAHGVASLYQPRLLHSASLDPRRAAAPEADPGGLDLVELLGERWYRAACRRVGGSLTDRMRVVGEVADQFRLARRALNLLTDRYLFPFRAQWFGSPAG